MRGRFEDLVHRLVGLTHAQATEGEARQVTAADLVHVLRPQLEVDAALYDAKQRLLRAIERVDAAIEPARRPPKRRLDDLELGVGWRALIEGHDDVCAEGSLDAHALLG